MNPIKTTPKDFFLHLTATVILYASIISLVNLTFAIINYVFPDTLAGYFYAGSVAFPISMLIVLTPVLIIIEWLIKRDYAAMPEKQGLWVRRWRIDLTLFLTVLVLIGDLVTLINTYISGEITSRFVYKFLAVLVIFGIVFTFYLLERIQQKAAVRKTLVWLWGIIVLAAVVGGFMTVGSPYKQRALRLDNQRINELQSIQWQVVSYWQQKEKLPATLTDLYDPISGAVIPKDPETKKEYEYRTTGANSFELCATFSAKIDDPSGRGASYGGYGRGGMTTSIAYPDYGGGINENWKHDVGRTCFTRTIDPDRYPPYNKPPRPL
jgi:hypothetical protein